MKYADYRLRLHSDMHVSTQMPKHADSHSWSPVQPELVLKTKSHSCPKTVLK